MLQKGFFQSTLRDSSVKPISLSSNLYKEKKDIYEEFVHYYNVLIRELNHRINTITQPIYLFGAHVFAQHLLVMGLNSEKIVCLLDNDENKQGRRLYGTKFYVQSPKFLGAVENPVVILKAGIYNDEIKKGILDNINERTIFLE
jgi:hypothetical protein